jgi:hypothetical protein
VKVSDCAVMSRGYGQYCPIAKASEVLGERWTPLILRNIHLRCHTFSEIHKGSPRMSINEPGSSEPGFFFTLRLRLGGPAG